MDTNNSMTGQARVVYEVLSSALKNGSNLSEDFFNDSLTSSAIMGSTMEACKTYGIPAQSWLISIASHPLPVKDSDRTSNDFRFMSTLILQVESSFFTVDFIQGDQHVGPVAMTSFYDYIQEKKNSFFKDHQGPVYTSVEKESKTPYSVPDAVNQIEEAIKAPWAEHRKMRLGGAARRVSSQPSTQQPRPQPKI